MPDLLVHVADPHPRSAYVIRHLLERMLGWEIDLVTDAETLRSTERPALVYGPDPVGRAFHQAPRPWPEIQLFRSNTPGLADVEAPVHPDPPPDPFGAVFRLLIDGLSGPSPATEGDEHARRKTSNYLTSFLRLSDRPVVDEWALGLADRMMRAIPGLPPIRRKYRHVATLDVDNGFKYLGRPAWRTLGSAARDLLNGRSAEVMDRLGTLTASRRDPYDIYDDFRGMTSGNTDRVIANFLVASRGTYDHAVGLSSARMVDRMRATAAWAEVGVHPSYGSSERLELIGSEQDALAKAIGKPVVISRQHFLRFRHPDTFLELERLGVKEDHSLGFHDAIGFRAGTCTPFPFYDLENERETELMIHPFQVMDSAMAYRMKLTPDEAIAAAKRIVDRVKEVQGTFIGVWHERFISDHGREKGWRRVVEEIIHYAKP